MTKRQTLYSIIIFFIAFVLFYFIFWDSLVGAIASYRAWDEVKQEEQSLQALIEQAPEYSNRLDTISSDARALFQALPLELQESDLITTFSVLASQSGLILNNIGIAVPDTQGKTSTQLRLSGTRDSLERFLRGMEVALPFLDIDSIQLTDKEGLQEFDVIANTYALPDTTFPKVSYIDLQSQLESALNTNLDIPNDQRFSKFGAITEIPHPIPPSELIGKGNPFAPL